MSSAITMMLPFSICVSSVMSILSAMYLSPSMTLSFSILVSSAMHLSPSMTLPFTIFVSSAMSILSAMYLSRSYDITLKSRLKVCSHYTNDVVCSVVVMQMLSSVV